MAVWKLYFKWFWKLTANWNHLKGNSIYLSIFELTFSITIQNTTASFIIYETHHTMISATGTFRCTLISFRSSTQEESWRQSSQHGMLWHKIRHINSARQTHIIKLENDEAVFCGQSITKIFDRREMFRPHNISLNTHCITQVAHSSIMNAKSYATLWSWW